MTQPPPQQKPAPASSTAKPPADGPESPHLLRSPRQKMVAGVCGGLGRYCDIDPVIFRIVISVLAVTGGFGLIFYGFAWLLIPLEGEEENEGRKLLSGRVEGSALIAVLLALIGCGLFLSMLGNGGTFGFSAMLTFAVVSSAVWSQRRRAVVSEAGPLDAATAHTVAEAPPETKAPPAPGGPSWWRDPIIKDGTTGPLSYLWGPDDLAAHPVTRPNRPDRPDRCPRRPAADGAVPRTREHRGAGGLVFLLALVAAGLGTGLSWDSRSLGTSLEIGLGSALVVFLAAIGFGRLLGRTGVGTIVLAVLTGAMLLASVAIPKNIGTQWTHQNWRPVSIAAVRSDYRLDTGTGTLDLGRLAVARGRVVTVSAEVGAGQLRVVVPRGVTVAVHAEVGIGIIRLPGDKHHQESVSPGYSRRQTLLPEADVDPAGTLALTLRVGVGQVEVLRPAP